MILKEIETNHYVDKFIKKQGEMISNELLQEISCYLNISIEDLLNLKRLILIDKNLYIVRIYNSTSRVYYRFFILYKKNFTHSSFN